MGVLRENGSSPFKQQKAECKLALRHRSRKWVDSVCRLANLLLDSFLVSFRSEFLGHDFLEFFSVHSVAFDSVHENVVAAGGGSLISRIEQADFQNQFAKFGLIIRAYLLGQK